MKTGSLPQRLSVLAALALAACAAPPYNPDPTVEGAEISLRFPTSSESLTYCPELIVVVNVEGVELAPEAMGSDAVEGEGHWHLLDGGTYVVSTGQTWYALDGELALQPGRHFFSAELVGNDHQPFDPPITSALVEFNVADQAGCVGGTTMGGDTGLGG